MNHPPRIVLIAAKLDLGGVADHVALLAKALAERGVTVAQADQNGDLRHFLTTSSEGAQETWVALHFVAYGWSKNGILKRNDIERLRLMCAGCRVAIYLHELWIGAAAGASIKQRVIGILQRRGLLRLFSALRPARLFTSNPVYQTILAREGFEAPVLPLPGNIPVPSAADRAQARALLSEAGINRESPHEIGAIFGLIHPEWDARAAIAEWIAHSSPRGRRAAIIAVGRHGPAGSEKMAAIRAQFPELRFAIFGERPAHLIAGLLAESSLGFATTPWSLIGKSGTAAAFLEAGLPVLVTRDDWRWRQGATPSPIPHPRLKKWPATSQFAWDQFLASRGAPEPGISQCADAWLRLISGPPVACAS